MAQLTRRELVCSLLTGLGSVGLLGSRGRGQTPARSPLTSALALATALVPNLEEVVSVYSKWLGFVVHWRGSLARNCYGERMKFDDRPLTHQPPRRQAGRWQLAA